MIFALGLSQPFTDCDTQKEKPPTCDVFGVGAIAVPIPPVEEVYQSKLVPAAVKGVAEAL